MVSDGRSVRPCGETLLRLDVNTGVVFGSTIIGRGIERGTAFQRTWRPASSFIRTLITIESIYKTYV